MAQPTRYELVRAARDKYPLMHELKQRQAELDRLLRLYRYAP
jgi:hypothetical protein